MRVVRILGKLLLAGAALLGTSACDPCFGTSACVGGTDLSYQGEIVNRKTGDPVAGARVTFVRKGGADLEQDSFTVTTNARGEFEIATGALESGEVVADFLVRPPFPMDSFSVRGVRLVPTRGGNVRFLRRWYADPPYVNYFYDLYVRSINAPAAGAQIEFRRTGGIKLAKDTVKAVADVHGKLWFQAEPLEPGEVLGDMVVWLLNGSTYIYRDVRFSTTYRHDEVRVVRQGFGYSLSYAGNLTYGGTGFPGRPAAGVEVEFRRTGGAPLFSDTVRSRTDAHGNFTFPLALFNPYQGGEVTGEIVVRPPPPYRQTVVRSVRLSAFEGDEMRPLGSWRVEAPRYLSYLFELYSRGNNAALAGADVEFRRTGGVRVDTDTIRVRASAEGKFWLTPAPLESGELVGDLLVRMASGDTASIRGIRLATTEQPDEVREERRGIGPSLSYIANLSYQDTGKPAAGVEVEFRRVGGLMVRPETYRVRTDPHGNFNFPMALVEPLRSGEVIADLVVFPPAPYRQHTIAGVRLPTFDTDEYRWLGSWTVPAP